MWFYIMGKGNNLKKLTTPTTDIIFFMGWVIWKVNALNSSSLFSQLK